MDHVTLEDVAAVRLAGAPESDGELAFTLIGERASAPNQVDTEVLDIAERHRSLLASDVPTIDGVAVLVEMREK
ncbi:hypothetical protein [Haloplanus salilacus]|uniref:hypothetical protein n=1 Tax=Haloplanus salilacus TaxID=2949994 RepID=UPI0030D1D00A